MHNFQETVLKSSGVVIEDALKRRFRKLRISLTNQCNFACSYCVAPNDDKQQIVSLAGSGNILSYKQLTQIVTAIHNINPLDEIKLTGGEPLLYHDLTPLIRSLKSIGINKISLTTNGQFLKPKSQALYEAGIKNLNVSLDSVNEQLFEKITGKKAFQQVMSGIDQALNCGIKVKINTVVMKGVNHSQLIPLIEYGIAKNVPVRFLELMKMGYLFQKNSDLFYSENEMLANISSKFKFEKVKRTKSATANYWELQNGYKFGVISNMSSPFCKDCDRLRLDSAGKIYGCICSTEGIDTLPYLFDDEALVNKLRQALGQKQSLKFSGSPIPMKNIGG